jgi:hypothetical protein
MQRHFSFRQGDRAEYLAQYILSAIAITVPVPRQEDVGADFHCSLLRREGNNLRPTLPFNIQIKSAGDKIHKDGIRFGGVTDAGSWRKHEIDGLCQTDTPFLIGLVDLDKQSLDVFSTITRYFVLSNWQGTGLPREVALMPYNPVGEGHLGAGAQEEVDVKDGMPSKLWKLPLGQPVVSISIGDSEDPEKCERIKTLLEPFLRMDQENAVCFRVGLGYFDWPLIIRPGQTLREFAGGMASPPADSPAVQKQLQTLGRIIASLLTSYRLSGKKQEILAWEPSLPQLPLAQAPEFVRNSVRQALEFANTTVGTAE